MPFLLIFRVSDFSGRLTARECLEHPWLQQQNQQQASTPGTPRKSSFPAVVSVVGCLSCSKCSSSQCHCDKLGSPLLLERSIIC
jgi:hypothetical protein